MKKIKLTLLSLVLGASVSFAQQDAKAKEILDKLSAETKAYSSVTAEFEFKMENKAEDVSETQQGSVVLKGDNYYLKLGGTHVIANSEFKWTVLFDAEEVTKESIEDTEEEETSPSEIFTMYETGFKYKYIGESTVEGRRLAEIELVPENPKEKSYSKAKIFVDLDKNQVYQFILYGKNGTDVTYTFKSLTPNKEYADSYFEYSDSICPDCELLSDE